MTLEGLILEITAEGPIRIAAQQTNVARFNTNNAAGGN